MTPSEGVVIAPGLTPAVELRFDATRRGQCQVLEHVAELLVANDRSVAAVAGPGNALTVPPAVTARDRQGVASGLLTTC